MNSLDRIGLEDLQELAESFANLNMVDLKMNQGDEVPKTEPQEGEPSRKGPAQEDTGQFQRTRRRRPKMQDTPVGKVTLEPIHPYGLILNLDEASFKEWEGLIDEWASSLKVVVATIDYDKKEFARIFEASLAGMAKQYWDKIEVPAREEMFSSTSIYDIIGETTKQIKIHFLGMGFFEGSAEEKRKKYQQALYNLRLMVLEPKALDEFLRLYTLYVHMGVVDDQKAMDLFFPKFPSPWREMLINEYVSPGGYPLDSASRRMSYVHKKLSEWCQKAADQRNLKRLRKLNKKSPLMCNNIDLPTEIGAELLYQRKSRKKHRYQPYERKSRRSSWKPRTMWTRQKARSYKSGQRSGPSRNRFSSQKRIPVKKTFRRTQAKTNESFKDCNCWTCGAKGHISTNCPDNEKRQIRRFESTPDIEDAIYHQELIPVYQFEDISSDESIYEQEEVFSSEDSEMTDGSTGTESD